MASLPSIESRTWEGGQVVACHRARRSIHVGVDRDGNDVDGGAHNRRLRAAFTWFRHEGHGCIHAELADVDDALLAADGVVAVLFSVGIVFDHAHRGSFHERLDRDAVARFDDAVASVAKLAPLEEPAKAKEPVLLSWRTSSGGWEWRVFDAMDLPGEVVRAFAAARARPPPTALPKVTTGKVLAKTGDDDVDVLHVRGDVVCAAGDDGVWVWRFKDGALTRIVKPAAGERVLDVVEGTKVDGATFAMQTQAVSIAPSGKRVLASTSYHVILTELFGAKGSTSRVILRDTWRLFDSVAFVDDARAVVVLGNTPVVIDVDDPQLPPDDDDDDKGEGVGIVMYTPESLAVCGDVVVYSVEGKRSKLSLPSLAAAPLGLDHGGAMALAQAEDGESIVYAFSERPDRLTVVDGAGVARNGAVEVDDPIEGTATIVFSPSGRRVFARGGNNFGVLWDVTTMKPLASHAPVNGHVVDGALVDDDTLLWVDSDGAVRCSTFATRRR